MANPIIILGAAGLGLLLLAGGKKRRKSTGYDPSAAPPYEPGAYDNYQPGDTPAAPPRGNTKGPSGEDAGSEIWVNRQTAMKYLADFGVCNSNPGKIDGKPGPATVEAIYGLQTCMGMIPDGKWSAAIDKKLHTLMNHAFQKAAKASASTGKSEEGHKWSGVHGLLMGLGYPSGANLNKHPDKGAVMAFQTHYNLVLTKMNLGKLKTLPGMSALGMLGPTGQADTKTVTALGLVTDLAKKGNIGNWQEVVHAAKNV